MQSCHQAQATCGGETACAVPQPGSVVELNVEWWNDSCSCTTFPTNASCSEQLMFYRFAPQSPAQAQVCLQDDSAALDATSFLVTLYFAVPLLLCLGLLRRATIPRAKLGESAPTASLRPLATLRFDELSFTVPLSGKHPQPTTKLILNRVSSVLLPQTLTAIMGPSGCGKTTLLDILANRQTKGHGQVTGTVWLNNQVLNLKYWSRISAYVTQFDVLFPFLTVREMLTFSAMLRSSQLDFDSQVARVVQELELHNCQETQIGDKFTKGISGGQARRVTVGIELLANPSVLFLDEPTSGLDSTSAKSLVATLKRLAVGGMTIACTIHQPRASTFQLFDCLILMKSGEVAYSGLLVDIPGYLKTHLGVEVDPKTNLADFIVDLTYPREGGDGDKDGDAVVNRLVGAWAATKTNQSLNSSVTATQDELIAHVKSQSVDGRSRYVQSLPKQVEILLCRSYLNAARNRGYHVALLLQNAQYLFYGLLFVGLRIYGEPENSTIQDEYILDLYRKNFLYQVMNTVCIVESVVISSAFLEKQLFSREFASGSYSLAAYHLTWYIRLTVDSIWKGFIAAVLCYFFPPLRLTADNFFFFAVVLMVVSSLGGALGFFMACVINDMEGAANIHNTVIGFMGTYAGFFLPSLLIPIFTLWAYYLSFFKYSFEALTLNEFGPCASQFMLTQFLSVDLSLNRWTNLLVLMAYPIIFHLFAVLGTAFVTGSLTLKCKPTVSTTINEETKDQIQLA
ncbi:hypothetical protein BASA81_006823 [Batrachochytrium salamandrivorans]|nr:hypothetical protein BASA81_006823 [Batrachochytrium salamandrivorans]